MTLYSLNSQLSRIKEPRTDSPWKRQILKARSVSYPFPILYTLIQLDNSKHRSRAISRLSEGRKIHVLSCNIDYRFPWVPVRVHHTTCSHRGSWAHVRLLRTKNYKKNFPQKHIEIWRGEAERLPLRIWRFHGDISARFFDAGEICKLRLYRATWHASLENNTVQTTSGTVV